MSLAPRHSIPESCAGRRIDCYRPQAFRSTRSAFLEHEKFKVELKALMPEDAKEAIGHGIRARRAKSGAVTFDLLDMEGGRASIQ
jgi:hypothetical protein